MVCFFNGFSLFQLVMGEEDELDELEDGFKDLFYDSVFLEDLECDGPSCPPPLFLVPPPPRPPELGEGCPALSPYESCDNIVIIDSQVNYFF